MSQSDSEQKGKQAQAEYSVFEYAHAITKGAVKGAKGLAEGFLETVLHPLDNALYPIMDYHYDAAVISAGLTIDPSPIDVDPYIMLLQQQIKHNPEIYTNAEKRMRKRIDDGVLTWQATQQGFKDASGPGRAEMSAAFAVSVLAPGATILAPGWILKGARAIRNIRDFGTRFEPPKFSPSLTDVIIPVPHIKKISPADIKDQMRKKDFMYVITEDKELLICAEKYPRKMNGFQYIAHPELANLKPVYAAGDLTVQNGKIISINNRSGHYRLPYSSELEKLIAKTFNKNGYDITPDIIRPYDYAKGGNLRDTLFQDKSTIEVIRFDSCVK